MLPLPNPHADSGFEGRPPRLATALMSTYTLRLHRKSSLQILCLRQGHHCRGARIVATKSLVGQMRCKKLRHCENHAGTIGNQRRGRATSLPGISSAAMSTHLSGFSQHMSIQWYAGNLFCICVAVHCEEHPPCISSSPMAPPQSVSEAQSRAPTKPTAFPLSPAAAVRKSQHQLQTSS